MDAEAKSELLEDLEEYTWERLRTLVSEHDFYHLAEASQYLEVIDRCHRVKDLLFGNLPTTIFTVRQSKIDMNNLGVPDDC